METRKIPINSNEQTSAKTRNSEEPAEFRVIDRRHFATPADLPAVEGPVAEKPRYPSFVEELIARMNETEKRFRERVKQMDLETARTRARLEVEYDRKLSLSKQDLLAPFLDVLDNMERALQAASGKEGETDLLKGLRLTAELFRKQLRAQGVVPVDVLGEPFDPNLSQAVGLMPVSEASKDGVVVEEVLRGYRMGDRLLRPAQVRVGHFDKGRDVSTGGTPS